MSDKLQGGIVPGSTDVSFPILLRKTSDNTETTVIAAGSVTAEYWRQGGTATAISLSALGSLGAAHADGGWFERGRGLYRLDLPDAAFSSGAEWVIVSVAVAGSFVFHERFNLGVTQADLRKVNGASTDGYNATLKLAAVEIVNANGSGLTLVGVDGYGADVAGTEGGVNIAGTSGATGLIVAGNGAGNGASIVAGPSGIGLRIRGGGTSGNAVDIGATSGHGITSVGAGAGKYDLDAQLAPDALDAISVAPPAGVAGNFREMLVQLWRRMFKKSTLTGTQLKTFADNGTTLLTTQSVSDDGVTQTQGTAT